MKWMTGLCGVLLLGGVAARGDVVTDWNNVLLETIRAEGGPPTIISSWGATMHAAMYDAIDSIDHEYDSYHVRLPAAPTASPEAAGAAAAANVLTALFPQRQGIYAAALTQSLATLPDGPGKTQGVQIGAAAAASILAWRRNDGSTTVVNYTPGANPGDWRPTPPDFSAPATPGWGLVRPWTMSAGSQFRPPLPPALTSQAYTDAFNEVKTLGQRTNSTRTAEQTDIAFFWANDVNGTSKPPGQFNAITQRIAADRPLTLIQKARLFAMLNLALADAGIAAWDGKYDTEVDFWRPITGIRLADQDGNPATEAQTDWEPLNAFTPPFPAYISGHATFAGAWATVLKDYFGADAIAFTATTEDPLYAGPALRVYDSLSDAARENARSRIYLGVHWQFDADEGLATGEKVGNYVAENFLRPVPEPITGAAMAMGLLALGLSLSRRKHNVK